MCLLVMETDVMISNQYNQFRVSGVSEHPVEATHVVLPVLRRERHEHSWSFRPQTRKTPRRSSQALMGSLRVAQQPSRAAEMSCFHSDSVLLLRDWNCTQKQPLIASVLWVSYVVSLIYRIYRMWEFGAVFISLIWPHFQTKCNYLLIS